MREQNNAASFSMLVGAAFTPLHGVLGHHASPLKFNQSCKNGDIDSEVAGRAALC